MKRYAHAQAIADAITLVNSKPMEERGFWAEEMLHKLRQDALPEHLKTLLYWIVEGDEPVTSAMVADTFDYKMNAAATFLNDLWRLGLLKRTVMVNGAREYVYEVTA